MRPLHGAFPAHRPEDLWNAAERAETRVNGRVAREVELALPAFLSPRERQAIAEEFPRTQVERYGVAVTVAIHEPGKGFERESLRHDVSGRRKRLWDSI